MIFGPPLHGSSNSLADWLELEVLISEGNSAPLQHVNLTLEIAEDAEPNEIDGEDLVSERRLQQVASAIHERIREIRDSYPFVINVEGTVLSLKPIESLTQGAYGYLFCLFVSAAAPEGLLAEKGPWTPDLILARNLFQICATIAVAGHVHGPSFSVGWPRPDSTSFLEKLTEIYSLFGDGSVHTSIPPGAPRQVKDDEIDVIAWKHSLSKPPVGYFLGQAASGRNWEEKSLTGRLQVFHLTWFSSPPATQARVGTILPFYLPSDADVDPEDHRTQQEIEGQLRRFALIHGDILHRHRVASYIDVAIKLATQGVAPIERIGEFSRVIDFVSAYQDQLREAAKQ